jgi:hypothetical protein
MLKVLVVISGLIYTLPSYADKVEFSIQKFTFELDFSEREQAIRTSDISKLNSLSKTTSTARNAYYSKQSNSLQNQANSMPEAFYLFYQDCQHIEFCAYFKSQVTRQLTQYFTIADQISINKVNNRQVLCDLDVLKNCDEDWADGLSDGSSIDMLPQLVVSLKAWRYPKREQSGYEAFVTLVEYGEVLWLADFHIPYKSPRPSLKLLASAIGQALSEQSE